MCLTLIMIVVKNIVGPVLALYSVKVPIKAGLLRDSGPTIVENLKNARTELSYLLKQEKID